ncbi:hypothetical protein PR202_ga02982 [Eleusine coracana subsp. coracana]|uniref:Hexosyltransferase n=1 Tax=Eleusine coracana subsp. coracana TaxID=191504 RepID=A0AAV5BMV8_ELECO|nr:hypothetical protein PR202_ga02982 [Eleusine coracana subsp. coracana]
MPSSPPSNLLKSTGKGKLADHYYQAAMKRHHGSVPKLSASSKALILLPLVLLAFIFFFVYPREFELQAMMSACSSPPPGTYAAARLAEPAVSRKPDFRLLIGVLTRADLYERRHLLRMDDQRVLVPLEILVHGDVIVLDGCEENLNGGKTFTFLSAAAEIFADEPYDYVMKADDDIFVRLPQLVESLSGMPREDMYYGATIPCSSMDPFHEYMAGMGYVLSWDLVQWIATSDVARTHSVGTEDMLTGKWLHIGGKGKNRFNAKPAIHDYLNPVPVDQCEHAFTPSDIAVHRLKSNPRWAETLKYFNFTAALQSSKFYKIDS